MIKTDGDRNLNNENDKMQDGYGNCKDDKVYVYEAIISEGCIKREPCDMEHESESIPNYVDIKEEIMEDATVVVQEPGRTTNIKEDCLIYCAGCGEEYDLYCLKCPMLFRILDSNRPHSQDNRVRRTLPKNFVDICKTPVGVGIVALRLIPEGVVFGPFEGLHPFKDDVVSKWKLKNKKLAYTKDPKQLNWMQYVRMADRSSCQNLTPFQCEDRLYYRSDRYISEGDELLVYWDSDRSGVQDMGDGYWKPQVCEKLNSTYACTLCCVGYKSTYHLAAHNSTCPEKKHRRHLCTEIIQCAYCKIYMDEKEYSNYHMDRCCARNTKKYVAAPSPECINKSGPKGKYKCSMCEYSTSHKGRFGQHQLTHSDIRLYKCSECPYQARTTYKLQRHMRKHANCNRSRFECWQCDERFTRADFFAMHQKKKHSVSVYKCSKCVFETMNSRNFVRHLATHKDAKPYRCNTCDKQFKTEISLLAHARNVHDEKKEKFRCPKCDFESVYRGSVKDHLLNVHSGIKRFNCSICAFQTSYKSILDRHFRCHEDTIKRENCNTEFSSERSQGHKDKKVDALGGKTYSCCKCEYRTNRKCHFDRHLKVHDADAAKPYACTICQFKTTEKWKLKPHIAVTHNNDKPFKCDVCPKMFKRKASLTEHARNIHSAAEKKEYKCPHCPFETKYKKSIEPHVNAHNKSELFQCSKCNFNTHHRSSFRSHQRRHESTKKHACLICSFWTNDEWELNKHLTTHQLVKPMEYDEHLNVMDDIDKIHAEKKTFSCQEVQKSLDCPTCGMTFNLKTNLTKHIKRFHTCKVKKKRLFEFND